MATKSSKSTQDASPETPASEQAAEPMQPESEQQTPQVQPQRPKVEPPREAVMLDYRTGKPMTQQASPAATGEQRAPEPASEPASQEDGRTFTQAEIDNIIAKRLESERRKFSDYDEVKAELQRYQDAEKSEQERQGEEMRRLQEQNQRLQSQYQETAIRGAIAAEAGRIGMDAAAAYKLADLAGITVNEDGEVSGAASVVQAVAEAYPQLVRKVVPRTEGANPARSTQPPGRTDADRRQDYFGLGGSAGFWGGSGVRMPDIET